MFWDLNEMKKYFGLTTVLMIILGIICIRAKGDE